MKILFMNNLNHGYHQNYMNVFGLISQLIDIETLRLTQQIQSL